MSETLATTIQIEDLHQAHPRIRAKDWRSPLVKRLLQETRYKDGACVLTESFRPAPGKEAAEGMLSLAWQGLQEDFEQVLSTYQEPVITEFATLGLACILVAKCIGLQITEVTRRGERADYWLGDREFLLEVSGQQEGQLETLCENKATQLLENPFQKPGYVCVAVYGQSSARLWFYERSGGDA